MRQLWIGRTASAEYRRRGNRDVYLTERHTGAQACVYPIGDAGPDGVRSGPYAASWPGGGVRSVTRREAFAAVEANAVKGYLGS